MGPSSRRIALLGANGQLGYDIARVGRANDLDLTPLSHEQIEVTNLDSVRDALERVQPTVVINSAAFHQVDRCEDDPGQAFQVNSLGAFNVARQTNALGAHCVYVSTDYVFPGDKPPSKDGVTTAADSYVEADKPLPLNVYGASKWAGEQLTIAAQPKALIVRVASLFGVAGASGKGRNFIETILKNAREDAPLQVVNDQFMTPTYTADAAIAILRLVEMNATGVVHVTNSGACTWFDLASKALELAGIAGTVQPVSAHNYPSKAERPANSALNTSLLTRLMGNAMRRWEDALHAYLREKGHLQGT
jgi:dTDP-4-dehydrorhamnose reductase